MSYQVLLSASSKSSGLLFEGRTVAAASTTTLRRQFSWSLRAQLNLPSKGVEQGSAFGFRSADTGFLQRRIVVLGSELGVQWSSIGGTKVVVRPEVTRIIRRKKRSSPAACWFTSTQIASNAFTWATAAVLPFYTLMVLAPNAAVTKRTMESSAPYVMLGVLYAYLLYLSWTPDMLRAMFASKYWLPELPGISKLFMNEMTVSSAWIHLLVVDLFAARQVFQDGLKNKIETRHSVSLCLLFCPVGILTHAITKVLTKGASKSH